MHVPHDEPRAQQRDAARREPLDWRLLRVGREERDAHLAAAVATWQCGA